MIQSEVRNPKELVAADFNPGEHPQDQLDDIGESLDQFQQFKNVVIWHDQVIAGKGVWQTAIQKGLTELEVKDYSHLTEVQAKRLCLADRALPDGGRTNPGMVQEVLANLGDPTDIPGIDEDWLAGLGIFDVEIQEDDFDIKETPYSRKIEAPIYEIQGEKPEIKELVNIEKSERLIKQIETSGLPEAEKTFLIRAAYRHDVFDFGKIAEYYAQSKKETQEQFEASTLIIIDFEKAIEQGYSRLAKDIEQAYLEDYADDEA